MLCAFVTSLGILGFGWQVARNQPVSFESASALSLQFVADAALARRTIDDLSRAVAPATLATDLPARTNTLARLKKSVWWDFGLLLSYGGFIGALFHLLAQRVEQSSSLWAMPLFASLADALENIGLLIGLNNLDQWPFWIPIASIIK
jgi:hypothetical protein